MPGSLTCIVPFKLKKILKKKKKWSKCVIGANRSVKVQHVPLAKEGHSEKTVQLMSRFNVMPEV